MERTYEKNSLIIRDNNGDFKLGISTKNDNNSSLIKVSGELSSDVSHDFEDELMAVVTVSDNIDLDLSDVTKISSVALRALLSAQQVIDEKDNASLRLLNMKKEVLSFFEEKGFDDLFIIV